MLDHSMDDLDDAALDELPFGVVALDDALHVVRFNRVEAARTGIQRWRALGRNYLGDVVPAATDRDLAVELREFAASDATTREFDHTFARRTGADPTHIELSRGDHRIYLAISRRA